MGRGKVTLKTLKLNKRRINFLKKKARPLCDFCVFSSYGRRQHQRGHEAVSMESQLKRLRLLTRRMTGKDLEGLSSTKLLVLERRLKDVLLIVQNEKKKIELEEAESLRKQKWEAEDEDDGIGRPMGGVLVSCKASSSSYGGGQDQAMQSKWQIEYERQQAESKEVEFKRLWLLKEKLNGRELIGMTSAELRLLGYQIHQGLRELQARVHMKQRASLTKKPGSPCDFCSIRAQEQEQDNEVERLRLSISKMTGKDDNMSFSELLATENHLTHVCRIVVDLKVKRENEGKIELKRESERINNETEFHRLWLFNERMNGRELETMTCFELKLLHLRILHALLALADLKSRPRMEQIARQPKEELIERERYVH